MTNLFGRSYYFGNDYENWNSLYKFTPPPPPRPKFPTFQSIYNAEVQGWKLEWEIGYADNKGTFGKYWG